AREAKAPPHIKQHLARLRQVGKGKKWTFQVGYTQAHDRQRHHLSGTRVPANVHVKARQIHDVGMRLLAIDRKAHDDHHTNHPTVTLPERLLTPRTQHVAFAGRRAFDWRSYGKLTPVRDQGNCGSCWDFAALGAFEASYHIRNNVTITASTQQVLDWSGAGSCSGGWYMDVFAYLVTHGTCSEKAYPYAARDISGRRNVATPYRAVAWGYAAPTNAASPSVREVKEHLLQHGPVV